MWSNVKEKKRFLQNVCLLDYCLRWLFTVEQETLSSKQVVPTFGFSVADNMSNL